jgi:Tol biopolymer transport system component
MRSRSILVWIAVAALAVLLGSAAVAAQARIKSERIYIEDFSPSWSPDSKRIVFVRTRGKVDPDNGECCLLISSRLYVMDADGRNLRRVPGSRFDSDPAWSPGGRLIAFTRRNGPSGRERLYVMRPNGTGTRAVRRDALEQLAPAWSPDGRQIAYWRGRRTSQTGAIYAIRVDGSGSRRIVANADHGGYGGASWSPDGERLLFARRFDVYVVDADGSDLKRLTRAGVADSYYEPTWSPDGRRIVFRSEGGLHVMRADGTGIHRITQGGSESRPDHNPSWSASGRWIAFAGCGPRGQSTEARIYRVAPSGRGLKRLTTRPRR